MAAAVAGIVTAVLLQATLIGPGLAPIAVSLPAVLVAAVGLADGPGAGMSVGFAAGLTADLASRHPAGVLTLCWLGLGLGCGMLATGGRVLRDVAVAAALCGVSGAATTLVLTVVGRGGTLRETYVELLPAVAASAVLALAIVPFVRRLLDTEHLRAPHPVYTELVLGPRP
ncbi:hypothetical protein GCM10027265_31740 [Jatrophihabitans fulvus]